MLNLMDPPDHSKLRSALRGYFAAPEVAPLEVLIRKMARESLDAAKGRGGLDAMGELGVLYDGSKYERGAGSWPSEYMTWTGFIIAGGTAQIQKNIISERGLGLPREPRVPTKRAKRISTVLGGETRIEIEIRTA